MSAPVQLRAARARHGITADALRVVTLAERPELGSAIQAVLASRWQTYMLAGRPGHGVDIIRLLAAVPEYQVLLLDPRDEVLGIGLSVPLSWDRTVDGLPAGWDGAVAAAADLVDRRASFDAVCGLSITMTPNATGRGLAARLVGALKAVAAQYGASALVAPVRPVLKAQYPLTPIARYLSWRTDDDQVFDPWLRLHMRLGGLQVGTAYPSMTIAGTVADWQDWTDLSMPASGEYVIPGGLVPLTIDRRADSGVYREPGVWVVHRTD
jgi:hypothetical protein